MAKLSEAKKAAPAAPPTSDSTGEGDEESFVPAAARRTKKAPAKKKAEPKPRPALDDQLVDLTDVTDTLSILYVGPQGSGKTTDLATMANLGPVIFINSESGLKRKALQRMGVKVENIRMFPRPGQELTFDSLEDLFWSLASRLQDDPGFVVGTCWDSVTDIHKKLLDHVVARAYGKAVEQEKDRERFFIDRADYGVMTEQVRLLIKRFRDLPCHFGISALERREVDDDGKVVYQPAVTPALQNDLVGWVDVVAYTSVHEVDGDEEYRGLFRPIGKYRGKDRYHALPRRLVDPTFERVLGYVNGDIELEDDPVMAAARERRAKERQQETAATTEPDSADSES